MNQDTEVLDALSRSLGHISRQRVRYIQMELRRFATDARITNERHFWSLLENNGLRLPKRTAGSFISRVKDQRGINVELVARYLKESHKRTRRDSVVALMKGEIKKTQKKQKANDADKTQISKRLSIDEFRRVGRLVVNASSATEKMRDMISTLDEGITGDGEEIEQEHVEDEQGRNLLRILMDKNKSLSDDENSPPTTTTSCNEKNQKMDYLTVPHPEQKSLPPSDHALVLSADDGYQNINNKKKKNSKNKKKEQNHCNITITVEDTDESRIADERGEGVTVQTASKDSKHDSSTKAEPQNPDDDPIADDVPSNTDKNVDAEVFNSDDAVPSTDPLNEKEQEKDTNMVSQKDDFTGDKMEENPSRVNCDADVTKPMGEDPKVPTNQRRCSSASSEDSFVQENLPTNSQLEMIDQQNDEGSHLENEVEADKLSNPEQSKNDPNNQQSYKTETNQHADDIGETITNLPDYSTDSFATDSIGEGNFSESQSTISESDSTEDQITFDTRSIADLGGEDVNVGGFTITMYPPEWHQNEEIVDTIKTMATSSTPKLEVEWVYGCETLHPQCMVSLGDDEIAYGAGSVVIIYNHCRNSQRHYLEHSGPITCVAVHSNRDIIASSQGQSLSTANKTRSYPDNEQDFTTNDEWLGQIHVRVWMVDDLTNLYAFGAGTFQGTVRKLQFMNYQQYLISIEDDELSSLTLWDGGCKLKRMSTVVNTETDSKSDKKQVNDHTPRAIACTRRSTPEFVIAGKEHLGFWKIMEDENSSSGLRSDNCLNIIGPQRGDFVKQFRPRHVTCCTSIERHAVGYFVSGDTNGTIMIWSDNDKDVVAAANHAHECPVSCVTATRAHVFSGGSTDRSVCAFSWGKEEMERAGRLTLPDNVGKITAICQVGANLFVATSFNIIVAVSLNHPAYVTQLSRPNTASKMTVKDHSSQKERTNKTEDEIEKKSIFNHWDPNEIARGSKRAMKCVCISDLVKQCTRSPTPSTFSNGSKRKSPKSVRTIRRQSAKTALSRMANSARSYKGANRTERSQLSKTNRSQTPDNPSSLTSTFSSPKLRTSDRFLRRQKGKQEKVVDKQIMLFPRENYIDDDAFISPSFPIGAETISSKRHQSAGNLESHIIWTSSSDGWLLGYDAMRHRILARFKLPKCYDVECLDCSPARGLIVLGCKDGDSVLIGIDHEGFKVISETNHCRRNSLRLPVKIVRFSKKGKMLAVGIAHEVVLNAIRNDGMHEIGRFHNHTHSDGLASLDWSSVRLYGSYLLRACYLNPEPEVCVWLAEDLKSVDDLSTLRNITWHAPTSPLEFTNKGIWGHCDTVQDISCLSVTNVTQKRKVGEVWNSDERDVTEVSADLVSSSRDFENVCLVGDELGRVRAYRYPCISSSAIETVLRPFYSAVSCIRSSRNCVVAAGNEDGCLIQFNPLQDEDKL